MPTISPAQRTALWRATHPNANSEWRKQNKERHNELSRKHMKKYDTWMKISRIFLKILL